MTTFAMPFTLDRNEEWTSGHAGHGYLVDRDLSRSQTFTAASGDLLDVSVVIPANPFAVQYGVDELLLTRVVRAAVGFEFAAGQDLAPFTSDYRLAHGVTYQNTTTQEEPLVATSAGGTWRPPATLWTSANEAGVLVLNPSGHVDTATGFLRFLHPGSVTVTVYLLLRRYPDSAAVAARQAAGMAALEAERASTAAQRAAQAGQWH